MDSEEDNCGQNVEMDPMEGLKQLEQWISEAQEFDSKQKNIAFNGNKMLNELLDKPIDGLIRSNDNQDDDEQEDNDSEDDHEEDDEDINVRKGNKRSFDNELEEELSEENNNESNSNKKLTPNSKTKNKNKRKKGSKSKNPQLRKNIKSILTETELDKETLAARKLEEERMARQRERSHQRLQEIQSLSQTQSHLTSQFNSIPTHSNNFFTNNNHNERYDQIEQFFSFNFYLFIDLIQNVQN
jgi:hypothetical protein